MSIKKFNRIRTEDDNADRIQDNIERFSRQFLDKEIIDGILLKDIDLVSASTNELNHSLGREIQGWIVVRQRASAIIWDDQDNNSRPELTLRLNTSADVTVDLWVF